MFLSLFNTRGASSANEPLLVHLPPFPSSDAIPQLPYFLEDLPVASINYRWSPYSKLSSNANGSFPLHWPTPVHDTSFAMAWLLKHLSPPGHSRRDIYVFGSYLGASLATSLALTEARPDADFGVRGLLAYNGIYNWTMFLPDHPIHRTWGRFGPSLPPELDNDSRLHKISDNLPALFHKESNLFDPFASPSLFFHCPGLEVPESFFMRAKYDALINNMMSDEEFKPETTKQKSLLVFPPHNSGLKIPETLIVYESAPPHSGVVQLSGKSGAKTKTGHSFESQAVELATMMRRSVHLMELRKRINRSHGDDHWIEEAARRVQIVDTGPATGGIEPLEAGRDIILSWLENKY
ncbi:hypothetical protein E4U42_003742 [Claviceps africana]|uniref:Alpha/beta hydrolase fold-3 domain-containing protein n=1 Tax=Claviceps africana TaxID=83212 RepID=A0A8K0J7E3_9HYPO|nr:hypothetical protein E4U42_003742 [Claviceps africana]